MFHIVFQEADIAVLSKSFDLDESIRGDITQVKDDFAVGPLTRIYEPAGIASRKEWWREVLAGGDYERLVDDGKTDDAAGMQQLKEKMESEPGENLWIWIAPNKHDVSGYYWVISQLKDFEKRVEVIWLNNLPFINEKGHIFYPKNLFEIPSREFIKAKKLARPVSAAEFEIDPDEWGRVCNGNKNVRTLEGHKKLLQHDDDFYDNLLRKFITGDWQKASKVIQHFLSKSAETTGDAFLLWRLKKMIAENEIDAQGEITNMKDFEVKAKQSQPAIAADSK